MKDLSSEEMRPWRPCLSLLGRRMEVLPGEQRGCVCSGTGSRLCSGGSAGTRSLRASSGVLEKCVQHKKVKKQLGFKALENIRSF